MATPMDFVGSAGVPARIGFATHSRDNAMRLLQPARYQAKREAEEKVAEAQRAKEKLEQSRTFFNAR
jgi:hypothetical protein